MSLFQVQYLALSSFSPKGNRRGSLAINQRRRQLKNKKDKKLQFAYADSCKFRNFAFNFNSVFKCLKNRRTFCPKFIIFWKKIFWQAKI